MPFCLVSGAQKSSRVLGRNVSSNPDNRIAVSGSASIGEAMKITKDSGASHSNEIMCEEPLVMQQQAFVIFTSV
ncbi:hypothetical protein OJAV_G00217010 [Oryzias javanicus]|uniref:Uncharacterized protein n=1 Tax=Oryzias javanicus TaxID=123683 RepID=A0A3S2P552_ORYJA|nr:hypothetical protein OJAV_G00217010 [Oryzias javanicus]